MTRWILVVVAALVASSVLAAPRRLAPTAREKKVAAKAQAGKRYRRPRANKRNAPKVTRKLRRAAYRRSSETASRSRGKKRLEAKNRGSLAHLRGLKVGKRLAVRNPNTNKLDRKAEIVETGVDRWTKAPYVWMRFANGDEVRFAAERLQLLGKPLSFQRRYIQKQRNDIMDAMEKFLGVPVRGRAKIVTLRGRNHGPTQPPRSGRRSFWLGPFLSVLGEQLGADEGLEGFERDGTAYVSRHHGAWDYTTTPHELVHAITPTFVAEAQDRGLTGAMEGLTDYFTYKVITPHYGVERDRSRDNPYREFQRFGDHVARMVGDKELKKLFFSERKGTLAAIASRYDKATGTKGAFYRHAEALEQGTLRFDRQGVPRIDE